MGAEHKPYTELREPNDTEKQELMHYYDEVVGYDTDQAYDIAFSSAIAVFENYQTDSPGYVGKVMLVVGGAEYIYELFIWDENNKLRHVAKDRQL